MSAPRKDIMNALSTLVAGAYPWVTGPSRRVKLWSEVPVESRPACFIFSGGSEMHSYEGQNVNPKRVMMVRLFIYTNAKDPTVIGADQLDDISDGLDAAFAAARDPLTGRATLGGLCHQCRIDGDVLREPGDLDGDGMLIVPVRIVLP